MIFLNGPVFGEPVEVWEAWLVELAAMDQKDSAVQFEIGRTQVSIAATREAQST